MFEQINIFADTFGFISRRWRNFFVAYSVKMWRKLCAAELVVLIIYFYKGENGVKFSDEIFAFRVISLRASRTYQIYNNLYASIVLFIYYFYYYLIAHYHDGNDNLRNSKENRNEDTKNGAKCR